MRRLRPAPPAPAKRSPVVPVAAQRPARRRSPKSPSVLRGARSGNVRFRWKSPAYPLMRRRVRRSSPRLLRVKVRKRPGQPLSRDPSRHRNRGRLQKSGRSGWSVCHAQSVRSRQRSEQKDPTGVSLRSVKDVRSNRKVRKAHSRRSEHRSALRRRRSALAPPQRPSPRRRVARRGRAKHRERRRNPPRRLHHPLPARQRHPRPPSRHIRISGEAVVTGSSREGRAVAFGSMANANAAAVGRGSRVVPVANSIRRNHPRPATSRSPATCRIRRVSTISPRWMPLRRSSGLVPVSHCG